MRAAAFSVHPSRSNSTEPAWATATLKREKGRIMGNSLSGFSLIDRSYGFPQVIRTSRRTEPRSDRWLLEMSEYGLEHSPSCRCARTRTCAGGLRGGQEQEDEVHWLTVQGV